MKRIFIILFVVLLSISFMACEFEEVNNQADKQQAEATEKAMVEANDQIGMPAIKNFQERKLVKMLLEIRDRADLVCYAYIKSDYQGKLVFIGKCIGYGIPYSAQFSNPEKVVYEGGYNNGYGSLPQPEPNGIFVPDGLSATWLMMIDAKGKAKPVYIEPEIVVSPFPLH